MPTQPNNTPHSHPTDLWSTACVRCPEALTKLDGVAAQYAAEAAAGKVMFATVNINDKAKGAGIVGEKCVRWMMMWWILCVCFLAPYPQNALSSDANPTHTNTFHSIQRVGPPPPPLHRRGHQGDA